MGELFDRRVRLLDGSGDAVIEDVAIEQRRNGDWGVTELFVSRVSSSSSTWRRRSKETLIVDWDEAVLSTDVEPQAQPRSWRTTRTPSPPTLRMLSTR